VIIFAPYWVSYPDMAMLAGGSPVIVHTEAGNGYLPTPEQLAGALTPNTKAVVINSPCNPSGAVLTREALLGLARILRDHHCLILTDDIYEKILFRPDPFANILNVANDLAYRTVVVNGMSKAFAMTGWRIGYAAGPKEIIGAMQLVQDQTTSSPPSLSQKAALAALQGPKESTVRMVEEFKVRREMIVHGLNAIEGFRCSSPDGAFYVFPNIQKLLGHTSKGEPLTDSMRTSELLLEQYGVAVVPGLPFGSEGHLRLSFATSRQLIEKGLSRLREFATSLQ
jgi:aspartate aminotransferase